MKATLRAGLLPALAALLIVPALSCGHRGHGASAPSLTIQEGRYAGAAGQVRSWGASVDPFDPAAPRAFRVRLHAHGLTAPQAGEWAARAYALLGPTFGVTVYDDTGRRIARADEAGASPKPPRTPWPESPRPERASNP